MRKSLITIVVIPIALLLFAAGYYLIVINGDEKSGTPGGRSATSPSSQTTDDSSLQLGQPIALQRWNLHFQLPKHIDVTQLRTADNDTPKFEGVMVGSKVVADKYNPDNCKQVQGSTLKFGELFTVMRYDSDQYGGKEIDGYYYKVMPPAATEECYDDATWNTYFNEELRATAQRTLASK